MREKPITLWILWGCITVIATMCELVNFDNNTVLQVILKIIGLVLFLICAIIFIISIINTIRFYCSCEKVEPARLEGMRCSLNLIREKEFNKYNKKVFVENMVKNCYYTDNACTSHVTYIITCKSKQICKKLYFSLGGGTDLDNIININYYFINNRSNFLDNNQFFGNGNLNINSNFRLNYKKNNNLRKALTIELPFPKSMKKDEVFQIVVTYTWKNCMSSKNDGTSYITDMFPSGIKFLNTQLIYPKNISISEVGIYKFLFNTRKKLIDSPDIIRNTNYTFIKWSKEKPKGTYLIERSYE